MTVRSDMLEARRTAMQKGKAPVQYVLNPSAFSLLVRGGESSQRSFMDIPITVVSNRQTTPTVALRCEGDLDHKLR